MTLPFRMKLAPRPSRQAVERGVLCALVVFLIAAGCGDDAYEPDDSREQARPLRPGETQSRKLCDDDWVSFTVATDSVYTIETANLTGGTTAPLRLWEFAGCSNSSCTYRIVASHDGGAGGSRIVASFARTSPQPVFAQVVGGVPAGPEAPSYDLSLRCLSACEDLGAVTVLPMAATRADLVTDLLLENPAYIARNVELTFSPALSEPPAARTTRTVSVPGGATVELVDVLSEVLGLGEASGSLTIRPHGGDVLAHAVLRDPRAGAGRGEVTAPIALGEAATATVGGATNATRYHLLLGTRGGASALLAVCEPTGGAADAVVRVRAGDGTLLAERALSLPAYSQVALDLERDLGVPPAPDLSAEVETRRGAVLTASVVRDRASGDVFVEAGVLPSTSPTFLASRSAVYRTELAIRNVSAQAATATASFDPGGGFLVDLGARRLAVTGTWYLEDPLERVADGSDGLLTVPAGFVASARALSRRTEGSVGSTLPRFVAPGYEAGPPRLSLPIAPGAVVVSLSVHGSGSRVSLLDERGAVVDSEPLDASSWFTAVDGPSRDGGASPMPGRLELEVSNQLRAFAILGAEGSEDVSFVKAEAVGPAFDVLALVIPGAEEDGPLRLHRVRPGTFSMGSPASERGRDPDEPLHPVTLRRPFLMAETELSLRQWAAVTGSSPGDLPPVYASPVRAPLPVVNVSWDEVAGPDGFLSRLNALLPGLGVSGSVRLPTEAEWEYAARGGSTAAYGPPFGQLDGCDTSCGPCVFDPSIRYCRSAGDAGPRFLGMGPPNAFGLREMSGNVWEWVADWYGSYDVSPSVGPTGPGDGETRVIRGGGWRSELRLCRVANRFGYPPSGRYDQVGVRLALSIGGP